MKIATTLAAFLLVAPVMAQDTSLPDYFDPCHLADDMAECLENAMSIRVIDGDTFEMDGEIIQLWGIDAPELDQTCIGEDGSEVEFGLAAADALANLLAGLKECEEMDIDRYGRTVAWCALDDTTDVAWQMVAAGFAWDTMQYSGGHYRDAEGVAYDGQLGHWRYRCIPPWEWRRQ